MIGEPKMDMGGPKTPENDDSLKEFVRMHEFPNRTILKNGGTDLNGKEIPAKTVLYYDPGDAVKVVDDIIYGQYGDEKNNRYWISIKDADYGAQRRSGYTRAEL